MTAELCQVRGCDRKVFRRRYCSTHYKRIQRWGTTEGPEHPKVCSVEGCDGKAHGRGLCSRCYQRDRIARLKATKTMCSKPGCELLAVAFGLCRKHRRQEREREAALVAHEVVACGLCGARLGTIPPGGSPWAAIDAHHCNRRKTA